MLILFRWNLGSAKNADNLDLPRYSNLNLSIIAWISPSRSSSSAFFLGGIRQKYLLEFFFCRFSDTGKLRKIAHNIDNSQQSNSYCFNTNCFTPLAGVSIHCFFRWKAFSKTYLSEAEKSKAELLQTTPLKDSEPIFFLSSLHWNVFLQRSMFPY